MPQKRKECMLRIENVSSLVVTLKLGMASSRDPDANPSFSVAIGALTLQSREVRNVIIFFEPPALGKFSDVVEIKAPGKYTNTNVSRRRYYQS
jgi:hypothetical protein